MNKQSDFGLVDVEIISLHIDAASEDEIEIVAKLIFKDEYRNRKERIRLNMAAEEKASEPRGFLIIAKGLLRHALLSKAAFKRARQADYEWYRQRVKEKFGVLPPPKRTNPPTANDHIARDVIGIHKHPGYNPKIPN